MAWEQCESCKKEYFRSNENNTCPNCGTVTQSRTISHETPQELRDNLVKQATDQAKVVDGFGKVLQVIGYTFIAIFVVALIVSFFTKNWIGVGIFLVAIPTTFVSNNVFGSALRAVALYIQVKVRYRD